MTTTARIQAKVFEAAKLEIKMLNTTDAKKNSSFEGCKRACMPTLNSASPLRNKGTPLDMVKIFGRL